VNDIIGHERLIGMLVREARRPAHAYLFVGPSSTGKSTVALRFADLIINPDQNPVDSRRVISAVHPDLIMVEPDGRTALTVDQARATIAKASLAPIEAIRKVVLLPEAGLMNDQAANALLKTLEEPSPSTVFILVSESTADLPATVASRSRVVRFGRVPDQIVQAALTERGLANAAELAGIAGGRPGLALGLIQGSGAEEFRRVWLSVPQRLNATPGVAFMLAEEVMGATKQLAGEVEAEDASKDKLERDARRRMLSLLANGLDILASWFRDAAAAQFGASIINRDIDPTELAEVAPVQAIRSAERIMATTEALEANQRPELILAELFADLGAQ
jgi:DNA polymerase-3 subunit delta'